MDKLNKLGQVFVKSFQMGLGGDMTYFIQLNVFPGCSFQISYF